MSKRIFLRAKETIYYGAVRRRPAEHEEVNGVRMLKRKADIFLLRERKGKDKFNRPITITPEMELKSFGDKVEIVDVSREEVHRVQMARNEISTIETFEKQQDELDEIRTAETIANAKEQGVSEEAMVLNVLDENKVDSNAEAKDIESFTAVKSPEEIEAEKPESDGGDEVAQAADSQGTGTRTVL